MQSKIDMLHVDLYSVPNRRMNNLHTNELHVESEEQRSILEKYLKHPPLKGRVKKPLSTWA